MAKQKIKWRTIKVPIGKIKPTPNNFKLKTELGLQQLDTSVDTYGRAGVIICNKDLTIINGNSNWERAKRDKEKIVEVSVPNVQLTLKQFTEFSAVFDRIRAGEVDVLRMDSELGDTKSWFKKWGFEMPQEALSNLAELEAKEGKIIPNSKAIDKPKENENTTKPVTLMFTAQENSIFLKKAEALFKAYKVDNVTDLVFKVFKKL